MKQPETTESHDPADGGGFPLYFFQPLREAVATAVMMLAAISITTVFIFDYSCKALNGEIREGLGRTALVASRQIDGDLHRTFVSRSQESAPAYEQALLPLAKVQNADASIASACTVVERNGKFYYILDPTTADLVDANGLEQKAHIMQEYPAPPAQMIEAFRRRQLETTTSPYHGQWGDYMGAYAPFYDSSNHFVGVVAIDIRAQNYQARLEPIRKATFIAVYAGFVTSAIVGFLVWYQRHFSSRINASRGRIYAELLIERRRNNRSRQIV